MSRSRRSDSLRRGRRALTGVWWVSSFTAQFPAIVRLLFGRGLNALYPWVRLKQSKAIRLIPIHELLNRMRWDPEFAAGDFELGYYDRIENRIVRLSFQAIRFDGAAHGGFQVVAADGATHTVPLHRIKDVYKDGELIWHREH